MHTLSQVHTQVSLQRVVSCGKSLCGVAVWRRRRLVRLWQLLTIYLTMMTYFGGKKRAVCREGRGSFMGINGIIKWNRKLTHCQSPYEGCIRLQVRLDICFMGAEHDWDGWIKLHELIRAVNDPWRISLVPAAPLVLIQSLPLLCVGEKKAFYNFTLRDEMVLWVHCWSKTFWAAWSMASVPQTQPCESGSTVELKFVAPHTPKHVTGCYECYWLCPFLSVWIIRGLILQGPVPKAVCLSHCWLVCMAEYSINRGTF